MIWKFIIGVGIFLAIIGTILGIIWKAGKVFGEEALCENVCCTRFVEAIADERPGHVIFHSRTCELLDNLGPVTIIHDKPLYMAGLAFGITTEYCGVCNLEAIESWPCSAFCCVNYSYITDMGKTPPILHRLSCEKLNGISGYHYFFIERWSSDFSKLVQITELCHNCFSTFYTPEGDLM